MRFWLLLIASAVVSVLSIAATALDWPCNDLDAVPVVGAVLCLGPSLALVSFVAVVVQLRRHQLPWAMLPLLLNIAALSALAGLGATLESWQFQWRQADYRQIVDLVEAGAVVPQVEKSCAGCGYAPLPPTLTRASCGGDVMVDTDGNVTRVFFFTRRGLFQEFSGYMYRSDDQAPTMDDLKKLSGFITERSPARCERKVPQWFFCSHTH